MTLPDIHATYPNLGFFARFWSANTTKKPADGQEGTNPPNVNESYCFF